MSCKFCRIKRACAEQVPGPYAPPCASKLEEAAPSASTNSDYAAALKVYREYRSDDKNYSTGGFAEFCEKRLHS